MSATNRETFSCSFLTTRGWPTCCRHGEHHTAFAVEVACNGVHYVNQPTCRGSETDRASANASVHQRFVSSCKFASNALNRFSINAYCLFNSSCGELLQRCWQYVEPGNMRANVIANVGQAFFKNGVGNCSQEQCIGTWANGQPFIAMFCCLALAGVNNNQLATAFAHGFKSTREVWCRAQTSIRVIWVCAQHQYVLRAI